MVRTWEDASAEFIPFLDFPVHLEEVLGKVCHDLKEIYT